MDPDHKERLKEFEDRVSKFRQRNAPDKPHQQHNYAQANLGWQMVTELVAGLMIGFGMGYALDTLFETLPVLLVIFTLLGLVAGVKTMLRTARGLHEQAGTEEVEEETKDGK